MRVLACALAVLGLLWVAPGPVFAHGDLIDSTPADGADLEQMPGKIALEFAEKITSAVVVVTDPNQNQLDDGESEIKGRTLIYRLPEQREQPARGTYLVAYRVVFADGAVTKSAIIFNHGGASSAPVVGTSDSASESPAPTPWLIWVGGLMVLMVGGAARFWLVRRRS